MQLWVYSATQFRAPRARLGWPSNLSGCYTGTVFTRTFS